MLFLCRICFGISLIIQASSTWAHSCPEELKSISSEMSFSMGSAPSLETKRLRLTSKLQPEQIPQLNRLLQIADIRASFESEDWLQEFLKKASEGALHYKDQGFRFRLDSSRQYRQPKTGGKLGLRHRKGRRTGSFLPTPTRCP